jgi:hypothetical protein
MFKQVFLSPFNSPFLQTLAPIIPIPEGLQPLRPVGTYTTWDRLFRWQGVEISEAYYMEISTVEGTAILSNWYNPDITGGVGATDCSLVVDKFFINANYKWRISYWYMGTLTTSEWVYFTMNTTEKIPSLISPVGSYTNWDTYFTIGDIPVGTEYWYLEVAEKGGSVLSSGWYRIEDENPFSPTATKNLPYGEYKWKAVCWGTSYGYGNTSTWQNFTITMPI